MNNPYRNQTCAQCSYPIDNQGLCVIDATHEAKGVLSAVDNAWCGWCAATVTACGDFMEGWLSVWHESDCEWAKAFSPLGEQLRFMGKEAAAAALNQHLVEKKNEPTVAEISKES